MLVSDAVEEYLACIRHLGKETQEHYREVLYIFISWCCDHSIQLEQINQKSLHIFFADLLLLRGPLSSYTVNGYGRAIKTFLYWCVDDEEYGTYVTISTVRKIKLPVVEKKIVQAYSREEIDALLLACSEEMFERLAIQSRLMLLLLLETGIRADELCTLTLDHAYLQPKQGFIQVMGKGRKERQIPIGEKLRRQLKLFISDYRKGAKQTETVFISRVNKPYEDSSLWHLVDRLAKRAGLKHSGDEKLSGRFHPHRFRHTFATEFMSHGGDIYTLSRFLGHSSVRITEQYIQSLGQEAVRLRGGHYSIVDNL